MPKSKFNRDLDQKLSFFEYTVAMRTKNVSIKILVFLLLHITGMTQFFTAGFQEDLKMVILDEDEDLFHPLLEKEELKSPAC